MNLRTAALLLATSVSACALRHGDLPWWVAHPPDDDVYLYAVGTCTGAATSEGAKRCAVEQAAAELARRFGVTTRTTYEEVRTNLAVQARDEIHSASGTVEIKEGVVQNWYLRQAPTGYDAFVLLRYPREQAEREQARQRSQESVQLQAASQALRRGDVARSQSDFTGAIRAYAEAAGVGSNSQAALALRSQAETRLSEIATVLHLEALSGDQQVVKPIQMAPLVVRATVNEVPVAALPLRVIVDGGEVEFTPANLETSTDGTATFEARARATSGIVLVRVSPDVDRLRPHGQQIRADDVTDRSLQTIAVHTAAFRLSLDHSPRALRIAVLIDERDGDTATRRSLLSALLSDRLHEAGFQVVAEHELGRDNVELLERSFDREQFIALSPALSDQVDVAIGGWCETRPGSENRGWATSVLADANVKVVELTHGAVIAAASVVGRPGFGEREDRARAEAIRATAAEIAESVARQLAAHADATNDRAVPIADRSEDGR